MLDVTCPTPLAIEGIGKPGRCVIVCTNWIDALAAVQELLKTFDEIKIRKTNLEPALRDEPAHH